MKLSLINSLNTRRNNKLNKEINKKIQLNNINDTLINDLINSGYYKTVYDKYMDSTDELNNLTHLEVDLLVKYEFEEDISIYKSDYVDDGTIKTSKQQLTELKIHKLEEENEKLKIEKKIADKKIANDKKIADEEINKTSNTYRRNYY
jgi:hypothetical protein